MNKNSSPLKDVMIVTAITLVAGMLLGFVYNITKGPIENEKIKARIASQKAVFSDAAAFEETEGPAAEGFADKYQAALADNGITGVELNSIDCAYDADGGNVLGYVVDITDSDGYGGDIEIMVGVRTKDGSNVLNGISFLALNETAGMGMKAKESPFIDGFTDLNADELIVFSKTGKSAPNEVDAISGATITTNAVTNAVNAAVIAADTYGEVTGQK
ncbi:MAG: FMN-binding protein [Lachnospiraceae bacterium]|nr:FMN-binding protein [Lachnospiraceae bacterium]